MRILTIIGRYLPGYKAGGPIRSIANLVDHLGDEFQFHVLTSDRDLGDREPYPGIQKGVWHAQGKAQVLYLSPMEQTLFALYGLLRILTYDLIYLNSCFSPLTIKTLLLRKLGLIPRVPFVLAPRGEFSSGALAIKTYKKRPYLFLSNRIGLYEGIHWQASSSYELEDIRKQITRPFHVALASPITPRAALAQEHPNLYPGKLSCAIKRGGELHVVFLSRISRKKNLDFALNLLGNVKGSVHFDIYGPIEDHNYWHECQHLIGKLPAHIHVQYRGMVPHQEVGPVFSRYHLFLLPTRGENFGHVILESLMAGCPVLISDQTPWHDLEMRGGGWTLPLSDPGKYESILNMCVKMDQAEFTKKSGSAREYASRHLQSQEQITLQAYRNLFSGHVNGSD